MSKRYLVPLDGSELGEHALPWVRLLAEKSGRTVELLQCHEPMATLAMLPDFAAPAAYDQVAIDRHIDKYLQEQVEHFPPGSASRTRAEGEPARVILEMAEAGHYDTVIMASHGKGGLGRWLLGSVTTKVVRGSRIPVMVVTASTEVPEKPKLERILVPLDGSDVAEKALDKALELAALFDAEIVLYQGVAHTPIGHQSLDAAVNLEVQNAKEYLESVKKKHPGFKITTVARIGGLSLGIQEQAQNCDLIVVSSHGRSGVKRWLLGSVAENLIQTVNKPLVIVYARDSD